MKLKISDLYAPIDCTDLKDIIPEGEDIVYSCFFNGSTLYHNKKYTWVSHILITPHGVAFNVPNVLKRKNPIEKEYYPWYNVNVGKGYLSLGHYSTITFGLMKLSNSETKDEQEKRYLDFFKKFKDLQMDKSKQHLEELRNNPDTKKKDLKQYEKYIEYILDEEERRKAREEKRKLKEEKKKLKKEKKKDNNLLLLFLFRCIIDSIHYVLSFISFL